MRHITVRAYGQPPCHGEITSVPRPPEPTSRPDAARAPAPSPPPSRLPSLPIVGAGRPAAPRSDRVWRCSGCGTIWEHEPLPDEAL